MPHCFEGQCGTACSCMCVTCWSERAGEMAAIFDYGDDKRLEMVSARELEAYRAARTATYEKLVAVCRRHIEQYKAMEQWDKTAWQVEERVDALRLVIDEFERMEKEQP